MSLYGALFSGVSGLTAQSSAMGAISDNITNVSTIGYKNTSVSFQTLVTKQTATTFYSAGGVQSKPLGLNNVQGLLQASTSQTDIAISGQGFFVVNESSTPSINNQYLYTRAGSFTQDKDGYLKNTSGYYLQAWPTDSSGAVKPANSSLTVANQNIISTDYLSTVNLNRVGGTASSTENIAIGANLPSNATTGATYKTDVQFFDTLGNANTMSFVYTRSQTENKWDLKIEPAAGTEVLTVEDSSGNAYESIGQLQFTGRPNEGRTVTIGGRIYEFDTDGAITAGNYTIDVSSSTTVAQDVTALVAAVKANDTNFADYGALSNTRIAVSAGSSTTVLIKEDGTGDITVDPSALLDSNGNPVTTQTSSFTVRKQHADYSDYDQFTFTAQPAAGDTVTINGLTYTFAAAATTTSTIAIGGTIAATLANLETQVEARDPDFTGTRLVVRDFGNSGANNTLVLKSLADGSYNVNWDWATAADVPEAPDGTTTANTTALYTDATDHAVQTKYAVEFGADGLPDAFNVAEIEILGFADGAANMDDDAANANQISIDFGTVNEANGMTQFGTEFTPTFITQNGSRFGTFAGVTISTDGLVTALFDNGEIRPIFKLPIATFVNPNALEARTGNVWNSTEASGDYTLRVADNGVAGQVTQASLEASTVDIGAEFTNMIVVQRAYSAAAKIISTADQMLEELMRTKR